jgi:hypothetical protein
VLEVDAAVVVTFGERRNFFWFSKQPERVIAIAAKAKAFIQALWAKSGTLDVELRVKSFTKTPGNP